MTTLRAICHWKLSYRRGQVLANSIFWGFFPSGYVSQKRKKGKGQIFVGKFGASKGEET